MTTVEMVKVENRSSGTISYRSYMGQPRFFEPAGAPGSSMSVPAEEIRQLSYSRGGTILLQDYLLVENANLLSEILPDLEEEYHYTKQDVIDSIKEDTPEEIQEHIEFAPKGVAELYETVTLELKPDSLATRKAVAEATGKNIEKQIELHAAVEDDATPAPKTRRRTATRKGSKKAD